MNYITTTELRIKSSELIKTLQRGGSVNLIHRSKVVGEIKPKKEAKLFDVKAFKKLVNGLNLPKTTYSQRAKIYRKHLMEKYGKGIYRR